MKYTWSLVVFILLGNSQRYRFVDATCVLSSDFGFTLNCAFKKSGLFRVRNLGGVKAHVGLGFTVGDELGFAESLSNVEAYKRRSASARIPPANPSQKDNRIIVRNPPARRASSQVVVPAAISASGLAPGVLGSVAAVDPLSMQVVTPLPTVPPFKPIPNDLPQPTYIQKIAYTQNLTRLNQIDNSIPDFQSLPSSISKMYAANAPTVDDKTFVKPAVMAVVVPASTMLTQNHIQTQRYGQISPNNLSQRVMTAQPNNLSAVEASILLRQQQLKQKILAQATSTTTTTTSTTMKPLPSLPSSPVRQTAPVKKYHLTGSSKVMNAPKEYYPVGYDKNFDDNFASRVELPETSFYCGDQKHFPGLYADEDLGCMVFHVCALTDDGLIMKSFLCPESTLFDQTILKCNWWFYVDCKNSKNLYDSNIPISKSYQLMKALTFFSSFKKEAEKPSKISDKDTS